MTAVALVHRTAVSKDIRMVGRLVVLWVELMAVGRADLMAADWDCHSAALTADLRAVN